MKCNLVRVSIFCAAVCAPLVASAGFFSPPNGFVFDAAHQHPNDQVGISDNSTVSMIAGGEIGLDVSVLDTSTFIMNGGTAGSTVHVTGSSTFILNGGLVQSFVEAEGSHSVINIHGGSFTDLRFVQGGTINIYGSNLQFDGFTVTGTLADGEALHAGVFQTGNLNLIAVPEPSTLILAACGAIGLLFARRRLSHR